MVGSRGDAQPLQPRRLHDASRRDVERLMSHPLTRNVHKRKTPYPVNCNFPGVVVVMFVVEYPVIGLGVRCQLSSQRRLRLVFRVSVVEADICSWDALAYESRAIVPPLLHMDVDLVV